MAQVSAEPVLDTLRMEPHISPQSGAIQTETLAKLKDRKRLLQGFQRMSSSPTLAKMGRVPSSGYRSGAKGSISCVSLSSGASPYGSYGSSLESGLSVGHSTAPTSAVSTPGVDTPFVDQRARLRVVSGEARTSVPVPTDFRPSSRRGAAPGITEVEQDYFFRPVAKKLQQRDNFDFWGEMPTEIKIEIFRFLKPREVVRCSAVSRAWHRMCFDGQLWSGLDTSDFYRDIPADALVNIITSAGPFGLQDACRNLENLSIEGCRIDRTSIHCFLLQNQRLVHINLSGLATATNSAMKIIAQYCPRVEHLNVSWCNNVDTRGLRRVIEACHDLKDLRAGEVRGWDDVEFMQELFKRNTLERLVLMNCDTLNGDSLAVLIEGQDEEMDCLTGRPIVPPRRLKHLDLTRCRGVTDKGLRTLVNNVPELEGLQLAKCHGVVDASLTDLFPTIPRLTHLDLEELDELTNATLQSLASAPCNTQLQHLSISYCENLGDTGMLPVIKACTNLQSLDMDNTRISDLVLAEAAASIRSRTARSTCSRNRPHVGLRMVVYDCQNVTWTGVREVLSRNAEIKRPSACAPTTTTTTNSAANATSPPPPKPLTYPSEIIQLKCFYGWQPTVKEHTKRVLRGDLAAASRLERKWADFMMASQEAGAGGAGARRRRRRAREAQMMHADEEDAAGAAGGMGSGGVGLGRRRRARSGGCADDDDDDDDDENDDETE
ncbi:hypothetical protein B0A49_08162, partial [Cryomyces minteri]